MQRRALAAERLLLAEVEEARAPHRVAPRRAGQEVALGEALSYVGRRVRVHELERHQQPASVRLVHQNLQLPRRAEARRRCEEGGDLVPERRVVAVFADA